MWHFHSASYATSKQSDKDTFIFSADSYLESVGLQEKPIMHHRLLCRKSFSENLLKATVEPFSKSLFVLISSNSNWHFIMVSGDIEDGDRRDLNISNICRF
ncbi:hypothetical protein TNIN_289241 [Trichonephila inaurata madagascariensis]|uniref:Uncharacterized protein n=1 Tax=Trichonephila inaurata madagascariensis TaxID=2747483 RepID=A0A8X6IRI8_9ARAC|nr:hypothetical protein TNIN_289241 [Trichonephila inaurata madagascariensis]